MPKNYKGINLPVISNLYTTGIDLSNEILRYSTIFYNNKSKIPVPKSVPTPEEKMDIEMDLDL